MHDEELPKSVLGKVSQGECGYRRECGGHWGARRTERRVIGDIWIVLNGVEKEGQAA